MTKHFTVGNARITICEGDTVINVTYENWNDFEGDAETMGKVAELVDKGDPYRSVTMKVPAIQLMNCLKGLALLDECDRDGGHGVKVVRWRTIDFL